MTTTVQPINSFTKLWRGLSFVFHMRFDLPDGLWEEVKDVVTGGEPLSREKLEGLPPEEIDEIIAGVEEIMESYGLETPW